MSGCDRYNPYCNSSLINNGACDITCMVESCNFDGNDCPSCYSKCFKPGIEQYTGSCKGLNKQTSNWCEIEGVDTCCTSTVDDCCYLDAGTLAGVVIGLIIVVLILLFILSNVCCYEQLEPIYKQIYVKYKECKKTGKDRKKDQALVNMSQRNIIPVEQGASSKNLLKDDH